MAMTPEFDLASVLKSPLLPSIAGSFAGMKFAPGANLFARWFNFVSGFSIAWYGGQLLAWFMKLDHSGAIGALSFFIGMIGMVVVDAIVKGIADTKFGAFFNGLLDRVSAMLGAAKKEGG